MKHTWIRKGKWLALALIPVLLCGCADAPQETSPSTEPTVVETAPPPTTPANGNPDDVTCKGSYTVKDIVADAVGDEVVATVGDAQLTNSQLQVYYRLEVAAYQNAGHEIAPDFTQPLDTQVCEIDNSVNSWQQYFLKQALSAWHSTQALVLQSNLEPIPTEEAYQPNADRHATYMVDIPAVSMLYGYNTTYQPNELHQAYLDNIPAMLEVLATENGYGSISEMALDIAGSSTDESDLIAYAELYNRGYMYFTELTYGLSPTAEEVEAYFTENEAAYKENGITRDSGKYVDMRHILIIPENASVAEDGTVTCSEEDWTAALISAQNTLYGWRNSWRSIEGTFAELAYSTSADSGSAQDGGLYENLTMGQLTQALDSWCFDEARQAGDTEIIRSECGYHIVYFCGSTDIWYAAAEADLIAQMSRELIRAAVEKYPMEVDYSAIRLNITTGIAKALSTDAVLYPDVAHERFPAVPLYLQQDYPTTMYGAYSIVTHGCGITTMAMLATYMTDTELTPPTLCARYGRYCTKVGTDNTLFIQTPAEMGFYLKKHTYNAAEALNALEQGYPVVCLQHKGYWTGGGHFLMLEELTEDGQVRVRDSNIFNYGKLAGHKLDQFTWSTITPNGVSYWIYEKKVTNIPQCVRCADGTTPGAPDVMFTEDYLCEACSTAMSRRSSYLLACN